LAIQRNRRLNGANSHYNKEGIRYEKSILQKIVFNCHYCNEPYVDTRQRRSVPCCEKCLPTHLAIIAVNKRENQKKKDNLNSAIVYRRRLSNRLSKIGLSIEWFDKRSSECECCGISEPGGRGAWHIDHDRLCCDKEWYQGCGECLRGLLCHNCNIGLGNFHDSPLKLRKAAEYIERNSQ
jgi:hypothetical protein